MDKHSFVGYLNSYNISVDSTQIDLLFSLMKDTLEANEKFNLTSIREEDAFLEKMVLDSTLGIIGLDINNKKVIDVGTGAGFPGMVLKIINPSIDMTLLDSTSKKIEHLRQLSNKYGLDNNCVSDRAESYARKHVEQYDFAFARAVSSLNILIELIAPMLKINGTFVALKGPIVDEEIKLAEKGLRKLNLKIEKIHNYTLPISKEERNIVWIRKIGKTDPKYPREYNQIKKRPL